MGESADPVAELRDRVEQEEKQLEAAVRDLKVAARRGVSPGRWVRENPLPFVAGAFAFGWWMGRRRATRRRR